MDASYLEHCKNVLRTNGFVVLPKERRVIVTARYMVPPMDLQYSRFNEDRYSDMVRVTNLRKLIHEADANGLVTHLKQDINDPVTGREIVFTSAIGLIKPKADDEAKVEPKRQGYDPDCCHKTVVQRCAGCPYEER